MNQPTPGPWHLLKGQIIADQDVHTIALITGYQPADERLANAQLILAGCTCQSQREMTNDYHPQNHVL